MFGARVAGRSAKTRRRNEDCGWGFTVASLTGWFHFLPAIGSSSLPPYTRPDLWPAKQETDGVRSRIASRVAVVWLKAPSNFG
jgi:hypothetical protein